MAHTAKNKKLGRNMAARKALLISQCNALIKHKRIITTVAKAKALARFIAPVITGARKRSLKNVNHAYRTAFRLLRNHKESVSLLFNDVLPRIQSRPGGYTRIIKLDRFRKGDGSQEALIEFVDFNTLLQKGKKVKTRRSRKREGTLRDKDILSPDQDPEKQKEPLSQTKPTQVDKKSPTLTQKP